VNLIERLKKKQNDSIEVIFIVHQRNENGASSY